MSSGALALENVTRRFGDHAAVDALSLSVARGELLALIGASGSGKTTTLRIAAGYEVPDSGRVLWDGKDITALPPQRRGFGMVFQHYALFPHMSVEENVAFGLEARGVSRASRLERAHRVLESVGLRAAGTRAVQSLSGGEQQRVALARALVIEPRVLLLDEPLSNLDPTLREHTREELRALLHRVGVPALFVTHDQEDAFAIADRIALMKSGRLLQVGSPEELYDSPASLDVASFIGRASILPAEDLGDRAAVTIGGERREFTVRRAAAGDRRYASARVVLRPEALAVVDGERDAHWRGRVLDRRFAGGRAHYRVSLADDAVVEAVSDRLGVREGETVGVAVIRQPLPLVSA